MGEGGETWMGKTEGNYSTQDLSNSSQRNQLEQCELSSCKELLAFLALK